jgi:hypothetical protein
MVLLNHDRRVVLGKQVLIVCCFLRFHCILCRWVSTAESVKNECSRQAVGSSKGEICTLLCRLMQQCLLENRANLAHSVIQCKRIHLFLKYLQIILAKHQTPMSPDCVHPSTPEIGG